MHEYIRETSSWKYDICRCCDYRTSFTCVKCKYCWSCHWKKERLERNELSRFRNLPKLKLWIASDMTSSDKFTSEVSHLKQEKIKIVGQQPSSTKAVIKERRNQILYATSWIATTPSLYIKKITVIVKVRLAAADIRKTP